MGKDHLDDSPSETVRRHAATFRSVRERLAAREAVGEGSGVGAVGEGAVGSGLSDEDAGGADPDAGEGIAPHAVGGDGLRMLRARAAGVVHDKAVASGWRVAARHARGRRRGEGPWMDSVVVQAARGVPGGDAEGREPEWVCGYWTENPATGKWAFSGGVAWEPGTGTRQIGARELAALVEGGG